MEVRGSLRGHSLDALFRPASLAVVGASQSAGKLGYILLKNVVDYQFRGRIYPVNPAGGELFSLKVYRSLAEIPEPVDLVLISVPAPAVLSVVEEAARLGVRAGVVLSSGFGETGPEGKVLEQRLRETVRAAGMRLVGPNCMGIYNLSDHLNGTYFWELPKTGGNISFISQSGAFGGLFFHEVRDRQLGISKFVSIGNMVDVDYADLLDYLADDPDTGVIAMFVEGVGDGRRFLEAAQRASSRKPLVALKAGRTRAGSRAASSHTGSMAGEAAAYEAAFRRAGIIWARSTAELFDITVALSAWAQSLPKSDRVAILTISGGPSVVASDACEEAGLELPQLSTDTVARIRALMPSFAASGNPVDMTPQMSPHNYVACISSVMADPLIDGAIAINVGLDVVAYAEGLAAAKQTYGKPVVAFAVDNPNVISLLRQAGIPNFPSPERAVWAYRGLVARARMEAEKHRATVPTNLYPSQRLAELKRKGVKVVNEHDAKLVLTEYGLEMPGEKRVQSLDEAIAAAQELGYPVALKLCEDGVAHKSELGAVKLGIQGYDELARSWVEFESRLGPGRGYLVQRMAPHGLELIVGGRRDPTFGPLVALGLGGVWTELLQDVALELCPVDEELALRMMEGLKGRALLEGFRGNPGVDRQTVARIVATVGLALMANPDIVELDLNPVVAHPDGAQVVDALLVLS
jgi:acetyltransferase